MAHPQAKQLNTCERDMVEGALAKAVAAGKRFENPSEVKGYLTYGCIKDEVLSECLSETFDIYVKLEETHRTQQLPSPPRSSVELRSNAVETGQEGGGDCPDSSDNATPIIASDDVSYISAYCPMSDDYRPLVARIRDGTGSLISNAMVAEYDLKICEYKGRPAVLLAWHKTNTTERNSHTWCYVVPEKDLDVEVVIRKGCSKEDTKVAEAEDAADIQNSASATEASKRQDLSLAEENEMMNIMVDLNHRSAQLMVLKKRKSSQRSRLSFELHPGGDVHHKRLKRSSGWGSDTSSTSTDKRGSSSSP